MPALLRAASTQFRNLGPVTCDSPEESESEGASLASLQSHSLGFEAECDNDGHMPVFLFGRPSAIFPHACAAPALRRPKIP
ncbi:hypothetical protein VTJ04DRAFT_1756 [Mycothermus thermophilus]|uniref:uncharacterized protein n=1 Tax=Humicola insolens TaxID=85995 RepID=UPI003744AA3C